MKTRPLKFHAALFGAFNFPADPGTIEKLLKVLGPLGFLPHVVNGLDQVSGLLTPKLALVKGTEYQIQLSNERIDFVAGVPEFPLAEFMQMFFDHVSKLESGSLRFSRIALIIESMMEGISSDAKDELRNRFLPCSQRGAIEWSARWVVPVERGDETYNACFEAMTATGMVVLAGSKVQHLDGVKVLRDISTTNLNTNQRFDVASLPGAYEPIQAIISEQEQLYAL